MRASALLHSKRLRHAIKTPEDGYAALALSLFGTTQRPDWHSDAACAGRDDLPWFDRRGVAPDSVTTMCASCPVLAQCREDTLQWEDDVALPSGMLFGYVAGMPVRHRTAAIRQTRRHAHEERTGDAA